MSGPTGLRVLVIEDYEDAAKSLALLLKQLGHQPEIASDGPAALEAARQRLPDVALVDIGLPGPMTGWEVASRLKELPGPKRPLLVAVTGRGEEEARRRSKEAGIDLHLTKPVDAVQLAGLLDRFQRIIA